MPLRAFASAGLKLLGLGRLYDLQHEISQVLASDFTEVEAVRHELWNAPLPAVNLKIPVPEYPLQQLIKGHHSTAIVVSTSRSDGSIQGRSVNLASWKKLWNLSETDRYV